MNEGFDRVGRPTQPVSRDVNGGAPAPQTNEGSKKPKLKINGFRAVFALLLGCVAILVIAVIVYMFVNKSDNGAISSQIKTSQYQAVFLNSSDGQVYFGKLVDFNKGYYSLTDIYYVRVNQAVQPDKTQTATPNISLAKLGSEIHGPEDTMYIAKNSVMFWENLKNDGQVVKAITEYKKNGSTTPTATPTTAAPTPTATKKP